MILQILNFVRQKHNQHETKNIFFVLPFIFNSNTCDRRNFIEKDNTVMFTNNVEARKNPLRNYHMTKCLKLGNDAECFKRVLTLLLSMRQLLCSLADGSTIWSFQLFVIK